MTKTILCILTLTLLSAQSQLSITYLANHGFIIQNESKKIEIDGFFEKFYPQFDVLSDSNLELVKKAKPPFDGIDVLLSTHEHKDHFGNTLISSYLKNEKEALFIGTPQITKQLTDHSQVRTISENKKGHVFHNGIKVFSFPLKHMGNEYAETENTGYLIETDGRKILHVGDADLTEQNYKKHNFNTQSIDFLIIPFWQLTSKEQLSLIEKHIKPKRIIASHIHPSNLERVKSFLPTMVKDVILFDKPLETKIF